MKCLFPYENEVERLTKDTGTIVYSLNEAMKEIERLRKVLERIADKQHWSECVRIAKKELDVENESNIGLQKPKSWNVTPKDGYIYYKYWIDWWRYTAEVAKEAGNTEEYEESTRIAKSFEDTLWNKFRMR